MAYWLPGICVSLFITGIASGETMKDELRDFRGIPWLSVLDTQRGNMNLIRRDGNVAYYRKKGESLTFGQADAVKIAYRYYKDQFSAGVVQTFGANNKTALLATLQRMHGEPLRPREHVEQYMWRGNEASIVLTCEANSYCLAEFYSLALSETESADTGIPEAHKTYDKGDD
jgi:hypothetical protein